MRLLILAGPMQSGKSSASNYLGGLVLKKHGRADSFIIDEAGKLIITTNRETGECNLRRKDKEYLQVARQHVWPHIKHYSFADKLKEFCIQVLGLDSNLVYGNKEDKEQLTHLDWKDMPGVCTNEVLCDKVNKFSATLEDDDPAKNYELFYHKPGPMTVREVLQYFGTNICRKMFSDCWVHACYNQVLNDGSDLAVIDDCRFPNELLFGLPDWLDCKKIIFVNNERGQHESERALDNIPKRSYDYIMPHKSKMTLEEKHAELNNALKCFGWDDLLEKL